MGTSGGAAGQAKEWLGGSSDVTSQTPRWRDGAVIWEHKPRHNTVIVWFLLTDHNVLNSRL